MLFAAHRGNAQTATRRFSTETVGDGHSDIKLNTLPDGIIAGQQRALR